MNYALYLDPAKKHVAPELPDDAAGITYWRLTDCMADAFDIAGLPPQARQGSHIIAEIDARQMAQFAMIAPHVQRVCINGDADIRGLVQTHIVDMTYHWKKRDTVEKIVPLLQNWIDAGVHQISLYDVADYTIWKTIVELLQKNGFAYFDRFHAARTGFASPYQKHIAQYGDVYAFGGWSRVTDAVGVTRTKSPMRKTWQALSAEDQRWEKLVLGMAHRDGMMLSDVMAMCDEKHIHTCCEAGYAAITADGRLVPTITGLWDNLGLVGYVMGE